VPAEFFLIFSSALQADQNGMEPPTVDTANQEDRSKHGDIRKKSGLYQNYCYCVFSAGFRLYIRCCGEPTPI